MKPGSLSLTPAGWTIAVSVGILTLVGVGSIYVTDTHYVAGHDGPANAVRQLVRVFVSLILATCVIRLGYQNVGRFAYVLFVIAIIALVPLLFAKLFHTSFGGLTAPRNGAYRWIKLPGFLFQPSEFLKVAFVLSLAWYLRYRKNYVRFSGLLVPFAVSIVPLVLILLEPDLGTALLLLPLLFVMLFAAGARVWHLALIAVVGLGAAPFAWEHAHEYQRLRVTSVLLQSDSLRRVVVQDPETYTSVATKRQALEWAGSSGYQLVHSKNALGSGGIIGNGWGHGIYAANNLLPDRHNDFVLAMIGHQWGLIGCLIVLACYLAIALAGVRIASGTLEPFARLVAVGVVTLISTQAVINVGMSVGLLPITGMTLPFVSYGGSSLLCNFLAVALLVSVSQHRPFLLTQSPFVFQREHTESLPSGREGAVE
jgi:cell division protein FtsW (lipid II flippase)